MCINYELYLTSFDLCGTYNHESNDPSLFVKRKGKLVSLDDTYKVDILRVCHCDGLLLCTTKDYTKFIVWNPYTGQTRWICVEPVHEQWVPYDYALGYDKSNHKILRFKGYEEKPIPEILDLNSNSWRVLDVSPDCWIEFPFWGLSLKGNMYWYGRVPTSEDVLVCFDFTKEMYGPHLPLPFVSFYCDSVILSSFREEQLAVLFHRNNDNLEMEIWVTTNIEPDAVSWSKFFVIDMKLLTGFKFSVCGCFLIDEEKRVVVVFDTDYSMSVPHSIVCFIGENGEFKKIDLGKPISRFESAHPRVCSYVPNSVRINQPS